MSFDVLLAIDVVVVSSVAVVAVELCGVVCSEYYCCVCYSTVSSVAVVVVELCGVAVSTTAVCAIVL